MVDIELASSSSLDEIDHLIERTPSTDWSLACIWRVLLLSGFSAEEIELEFASEYEFDLDLSISVLTYIM